MSDSLTGNPASARVNPDELGRFARAACEVAGMPVAVADEVADALVDAELTGHPSHGIRQLPELLLAIQEGRLHPTAEPKIERETGIVTLVDGALAPGPLVGRFATDLAVARAGAHGAGAVAVRRAGHMLRLAAYAERAANQGCVLLILANDSGASQHVAPYGGIERRLSTNPLSIGVPRAGPDHLVVDLATSVRSHGDLAVSQERDGRLPPDAVQITAAGAPRSLQDAVMLPMGGAKGFGLALIVEALAGVLTGAGAVGPNPGPELQGALFIGLDVAHFRSLGDFALDVDAMLEWVCSSAPAQGTSVRAPGEFSARRDHTRQTGVYVDGATLSALTRLATELGLAGIGV